MPSPMTFTAERTAAAKPIDTDVVNIDEVGAALQAIGNRAEWPAKSLADLKAAVSSVSDGDYNNASFATIVDGSLTFTDVSLGDKLVLLAQTSWSMGVFTADGTDPYVELRWLVGGATDATVGGDGAYPKVQWGVSIGATPTDIRSLTCLSVHTAVATVGSLAAALQSRHNNSHPLVKRHSQLVGLHLRLGKP